ncbi:MAG: SUMF1/EgtB/PvdO family nonheme iron enzyme, partial [Planctomycetota bacterium]
ARRMGLDHRTDVFSLGVVLYELLTLRRPFEGDTTHQVAEQILYRDPPDPRTIRSRIPRDLAVIVGKALEKERDKRYATMQELAADLRRHLADEPIHATPPTRVDRAVKWIKRNPGKSSAAAILAVTFTVIALLLIANVRTNRALVLKTNEAEANATEARDQAQVAKTNEQRADREAEAARRKADEVLRLSAFQRLFDLEAEANRLWPAEPERLPEYERWLERAHELVAGLDPHGDDPGHRAQLAKLRERAVPLSGDEREAKRRVHPRFCQLAPLERKVAALRAAQAVRDGKTQPAPFTLDASKLPANADGLNGLAQPLVDPARTEFGREAEGLALARLAIEKVEDDESAARAGETLAWALFANGLDEEALKESAAALEAAPAEQRNEHEGQAAKLSKAVGATRSGSMLSTAELELTALQTEISAVEDYHFADEQDTWWHNQLQKLVSGIQAFADERTGLYSEGTSPEAGWGVKKRLAEALALKDSFGPEGEHAKAWSEAMPAIRSAYPGLTLTPQLGLLPLGPDPQSGLWEFANLATGQPTVRGADGKLVLKEDSGLVFVLLRGGTFQMGAQKNDPNGANFDPQADSNEGPVHPVTLSAFFLSKYEMTQAQWLRFTGRNPSYFVGGMASAKTTITLQHPVESVSWTDCEKQLRCLGLELPSDAQWEYACRAGTVTIWNTGGTLQSLRGFANIADEGSKDAYAADWFCEAEFSDGWDVHCPVGSLSPNGFGIHEMNGNVLEWCQNRYEGDPEQMADSLAGRVFRGGSYHVAAERMRSAHRAGYPPSYAASDLGVRPAKRIAP